MRHWASWFLFIVTAILFIVLPVSLKAAEIYLNNGDKISGVINEESAETLILESEAMGVITINKKHISRIEDEQAVAQVSQPAEAPEFPWERELSIGYLKSTGNTKKSELTSAFSVHRKRDIDETTLKAEAYYSSSDRKMDAKKWSLLGRYALSFGFENKSFNFYRLEVDHDRFANIKYRITPSLGVGHWFSDKPEWKLMAEIGFGVEHTKFRDETKENTEPILTPRVYLEKLVFDDSKFTQDIIMYPSLKELGEVRLHGETSFVNPINDKLSLKLSWINDYDTEPASGKTRHDMRFTSSLLYKF
ncbi:YdiY family protein [Candidatus Omnitrophota bacterium]